MDCRYCQKRDAHPICDQCKRDFGYYRRESDNSISDSATRRYEETGR
jgi:hypothetical protein